MYSLVYTIEKTAFTRNKTYYLANEYAKSLDQSFEMPEYDECKTFVNDKGTKKIREYLAIYKDMEKELIRKKITNSLLYQTMEAYVEQ